MGPVSSQKSFVGTGKVEKNLVLIFQREDAAEAESFSNLIILSSKL